VENPKPFCKADGIIVKSMYSAISVGTEKWIVEFGQGNYLQKAKEKPNEVKKVIDKVKQDGIINTFSQVMNKLDEPMALGYSLVGEVIEVGKNVTEFEFGDLVSCMGGGHASHSELNYVPKNMAVKLGNEKYIKESSLGAVAGIVIEGIKMADIGAGENVAIIGLGLLGQIAVQILKASGCMVVGIEPDEFKRSLAHKCGCDLALSPDDNMQHVMDLTQGFGVDKVLITATTKSYGPITQAGEIIRDRGIISVIGAISLYIPRDIYYKKELSIVISRSYGAGRYDPAYEEKGVDYPIGYARWTEKRNVQLYINYLESGKLKIDKLITHLFDFYDAPNAYELITNNKNNENFISVLLEYKKNMNDAIREFEKTVITSRKPISPVNVIRVGLIGAGNFVSSTMLSHMLPVKDYNFIGIASSSGSTATYIASKYDFKYSTTDYRELLYDENINLIIISSNHNTHSKFVSEALLAGKDVYCEKPLAITKEGLEMVKIALSKSSRRLFIGFNRRFSPAAVKIKKILESRQCPIMINYIMNAGYVPSEHWVNDIEIGGGRVIGEACHIVDLFRYLIGSPVSEKNISPISYSNKENTPNANANISIKYEDGSVGNILYTSMGDKAYPKEKCLIFNSQMIIEMNNYKSISIYRDNKCNTIKYRGIQKGFKEEYIALAKSFINGEEFPIPVAEIIETSGILLK
ncbi:bi-domain-containing oxidoreductase, partial [candidate division WOR-3 bacterium]|nr:bi-domain-containing oxidoreductase [candidate division WOR-3 bacterium]